MGWFLPVRRMGKRESLVVLATGLIAALAAVSPAAEPLHGLSIDVLTALSSAPATATHESRVAVIAIDEETYRTPPFDGTPYVTWTPEIARVLDAVADGGAKVVGFDIVFPTSIEQSGMPVGDTTLGDRVRGFDKEFLRTLAHHAQQGRLVLGEFLDPKNPIRPSPGQRAAVGFDRNIRPLDMETDQDGVIRTIPLSFVVAGHKLPSMATELALRSDSAFSPQGESLTLNFSGGTHAFPTYSLADIRKCAATGDRAFFARNFGGKIVLVGGVLGVEDRKLTSRRFSAAPMSAEGERCQTKPDAYGADAIRQTVPGVFVHATAINNLIDGDGLRELGPVARGVATGAASLVTGAAAIVLGPLAGSLLLLLAGAAMVAGAAVAFAHSLVVPLGETLVVATAAFGVCGAYRFAVGDREIRLLRSSFALYLAPAVIETLVRSEKLPELGGETRTVSILFFDLAGFSSLAEKAAPAETVRLINSYFSAMADVIESLGGFVDQYLGDGIKAVFGAPLADPHHAVRAVRAALRCEQALLRLNNEVPIALAHRIGINSGPSLVGNIGSRRRFNYAVIGDPVNVASRAEGANKYYGTTTIVTEQTVELCKNQFFWRELDAVRFKGRSEVIRIYQPLSEIDDVDGQTRSVVAAYERGLALWRRRDFAGAIAAFSPIAERDRPAALFLVRARELFSSPPGRDWEPVNTMDAK